MITMNIQLFAEGGEDGQQQQTPSFDDMLKSGDYQSEFDKRVTKALNTAKAQWEKDAKAREQAARTEAERLANMTAQQKAEHEAKEREDQIAARERAVTLRELKAEALGTLAERKLPKELADVLDYSDAEKCKTSLDAIEKAFRAAVQAGVESRMKGTTPKKGAPSGGMTRDEIMAIKDPAERQKAIYANPGAFGLKF